MSATESRDWTKASTPELQSGSKDESDVLDAKAKERRHCKQVKREEKQHREEVERRGCEEVEAMAREEAERQACEQVEKDRVEVQWRAAEVAARQRALVQEVLKKQAREEPEVGSEWRPERRGPVSNIFISFALFSLLTSWQVPPLHEAQG